MKRQACKKNRRGAAIVEMAIVLPLFFAVVLGIIEFGRAMMVNQLMTNAAREATRMAIVDGSTNDEVEDWIEDFLTDTLKVSAADLTTDIQVDPGPGNPDPGDQLANATTKDVVTIEVQVPFEKVQYFTGKYLAGKQLSGKSSMRHE